MRSPRGASNVSIKNAANLKAMRAAGRLASECLAWILAQVQPGMSTLDTCPRRRRSCFPLKLLLLRGPRD